MAVISRTKASLRIMSDELVPDEITKLLGALPTFEQVRGEVLVGKNTGTKREAKFGMWNLRAKVAEPGDLEGQIFEILNKLEKDIDVWKEITSSHRANMFCGLFMRDSNEGFMLSPKALSALGERNIELDLDIYDG